ncbi:MAG: AfsR/SARP family transcriptional regulator [Candidatus Promineifilaceae bacterium]
MESKSQLHLLGTFQFVVDGEPITTFRSDKVRALFAWLAIESNRSHQRQILATLLWGDFPDRTALKNLRMSLSNLKKMLINAGLEELLTITRSQLELSAKDLLECDALKLQRLMVEVSAHPHPNGKVCARCLPKLEQAVALYRGEFMAGLFVPEADEFSQWQNVQRELLHDSVGRALDVLIEQAGQARDENRVQRFVNRRLALTPWHEIAHRALMRSFARSGRWDAALTQYESCERVLWDELGVSPSADTFALYNQIKTDMQLEVSTVAAIASAKLQHNLPRLLPAFFGRNAERIQLAQHLRDPAYPLVTIVGEGGIGKTHLSLTVGAELLPDLLGGVWFVTLEPIDPTSKLLEQAILAAIAEAMQVDLRGTRDPLTELLVWLQRAEMLLVLDNLEHLAGDRRVSKLIEMLLNHAPELTILVTSRRPLRMRVEHIQRLTGLPVPESAESAAGRSSIELFAERAMRASGYALHPNDLTHIVAICRAVEGVPLAIELAAGWTSYMRVSTIAETLQQDVGQLESANVDVPDRHRSLQAVFDSSWSLLPIKEQQLLASLAVFQGGFTREAAQKIAAANGFILASLVDKSLLRRSDDGSQVEDRYFLPIVVRRYAVERLQQQHDLSAQVAKKHAHFYVQRLITYRQELKFNNQTDIGRQFLADVDNIRRAWCWHIEHHAWTQLDAALLPLFYLIDTRSRYRDGRNLFGDLVAQLESVDQLEADPMQALLYGRARARLGWFTSQLGEMQLGQEHLGQALTLFERIGNSAETVFCFNYLAAITMHAGGYKEARHLVQIGRERAIEADDPLGLITANNILGRTAWYGGDFVTATGHYADALALARQTKHLWSITFSLEYLGEIAFAQRDYAEAMRLYQESLAFRLQLDDQRGIGLCSHKMADTALEQGDFEQAERLYRRALDVFDHVGNLLGVLLSLNRLGTLALIRPNTAEARKQFMMVLKYSELMQAEQAILTALNGMARVLVAEGKHEQAVALWSWLRSQALVPLQQEEIDGHWTVFSAEIISTQRHAIEQRHQGQTVQQVVATIW